MITSENEFVLKRQLKLHELLAYKRHGYSLSELSSALEASCAIVSCSADTIRKDIKKFRACGAQIGSKHNDRGKVFYYLNPNQAFPVQIWNGSEDVTRQKVRAYLNRYRENPVCAAALELLKGNTDPLSALTGRLPEEVDQAFMHTLIEGAMSGKPVTVSMTDDTTYTLQVKRLGHEECGWQVYGTAQEHPGETVKLSFNEIDCVDL